MKKKVDLKVDFCSYQAAKFAVEHWHYSQSMPTPPVVRVGAWEDGAFIGSVLFSRGANKNLGSFVNLTDIEVCELSRVALTNHCSPITKILSLAIRLFKQSSPNTRLIVSYADANQEHIGTIYQAGNWLFHGQTPPSYLYKDKNGRVWHQRQVSKTGVKPQYGELRYVPKIDDCKKIPQLGKYRYLIALDKAMRRQIAHLAKPYPKKDAPPVNGDNAATSREGRFDPDPEALETAVSHPDGE